MRAAAACTIALLLALVVAPPVLEASLLLAELHDAGHVLVFASIGALLCALIEPRGWRFALPVAVAAAFAAGTEFAQPYFSGGTVGELASVGDVGRDLLGTAVGLLAWYAIRHRRRGLLIPAALLLAAGLAPLAFTSWAYAQRALHPEVVWDAGRLTSRVFLEPPNDGQVEWRARGLRFTATGNSYAGIAVREPTPDWRGYHALRITLANPGPAPVRINVRIDDRPRDTEYEDRFNRERTLPADATVDWRIPLDEIERGPRDRRLDLSRVERIVVFLSKGSKGASFDLQSLRLERAP
jgi:hypothetical protein